ncbi:hypothetical protein V8C43DRAFT_57694 [Trichoderma afarasin]
MPAHPTLASSSLRLTHLIVLVLASANEPHLHLQHCIVQRRRHPPSPHLLSRSSRAPNNCHSAGTTTTTQGGYDKNDPVVDWSCLTQDVITLSTFTLPITYQGDGLFLLLSLSHLNITHP